MARVEELLKAYTKFVAYGWKDHAAPEERVWFGLYDPAEERRMRFRVGAFEEATMRAGHGWLARDLSGEFALWMSSHEYRDSYFESPEDLTEDLMDDFAEHVAAAVIGVLTDSRADENAVVVIYGLGSLFGLLRISRLLEMVSGEARGRLLVFFPGEHDRGNYRLLDARDGWNYLAVPINAQEG